MSFLFTSESVSEGHPDKVCDQISDAILDAALAQDPNSRVACECFVTTGLILVGGEISTKAVLDIQTIARQTVSKIGYTNPYFGFDARSCAVITSINKQSPDIAQGVNKGEGRFKELGAGDQGLMFGFACNQTPSYMPLPIDLAHKLMRELANHRKTKTIPYLRPDAKSQVTVEYKDGVPKRIDTIVISTQHEPDIAHNTIETDIIEKLIIPFIPNELLDTNTRFLINPTGKFIVGGPQGDAGLTGRKIIVDTYGGWARHGGGAFSGKDCTKVDRAAAYMARYAAKNLVAAGLCDAVEIQLAYAIGVAQPVSIFVNTFGTGRISELELTKLVQSHFDFSPEGIITTLELTQPIFKQTAVYGHFGRDDISLPWEKTDRVEELKKALG